MTICKGQGQSLKNVEIYLFELVSSHGQLYVTISRIITRKQLKILFCDKDKNNSNITSKIIY